MNYSRIFIITVYNLCLLLVTFFSPLHFSLSTARAETCKAYTNGNDMEWYDESEYSKDVNYKRINKTKLGDTKFNNTKINVLIS